jgi:hypothetical protein
MEAAMEQTTPTVRIVVEMSRGPRPLAGAVTAAEGRVTPFGGWLELVAAIEQARLTMETVPSDNR